MTSKVSFQRLFDVYHDFCVLLGTRAFWNSFSNELFAGTLRGNRIVKNSWTRAHFAGGAARRGHVPDYGKPVHAALTCDWPARSVPSRGRTEDDCQGYAIDALRNYEQSRQSIVDVW